MFENLLGKEILNSRTPVKCSRNGDCLQRFQFSALFPVVVYIICSLSVALSAIQLIPSIARLAIYFYLTLLIGCISVLRFCFLIQILTIFFEKASKSLEKSINNRELAVSAEDWRWQSRANYHSLVKLQRIYLLLWQCSLLINDCFGTGLVTMFGMFFLSSVYRGFLLCNDVMSGTSKGQRQLIGLFHILFAVFIVHYDCEKCSKSVIMS